MEQVRMVLLLMPGAVRIHTVYASSLCGSMIPDSIALGGVRLFSNTHSKQVVSLV